MVEDEQDLETRRMTIHGADRVRSRDAFRQELIVILTEKDPARLPDVEHLVEKYDGLEDEFIEALRTKHDWHGATDAPTPKPYSQQRERSETIVLDNARGTRPLQNHVPQVSSAWRKCCLPRAMLGSPLTGAVRARICENRSAKVRSVEVT